MPYRTAENVIEGLVMTIIDIERTKKGELALRATEDRYRALVTEELRQSEKKYRAMYESDQKGSGEGE